MADALDLLKTRRSIPCINLTAPGPSDDQIRTLLTIATRVPDHGKLAPWRFILFQGEARHEAGAALEAIRVAAKSELDEATREQERSRLSRAPLVVAVVSTAAPHPKIPLWEQQLSAGAVCMNLLSAAHAIGFAAQWITEWYAYDEAARAVFDLGENERIAGFVHIGTPKVAPFERPRPDIDTLVTAWSATAGAKE